MKSVLVLVLALLSIETATPQDTNSAPTYICPNCGASLSLTLSVVKPPVPLPLPMTNVFVVIGDSLSAPWPPLEEWTAFMPKVSSVWSNAFVLNFAVSGQRTSDAVARYPTTVHTIKLTPNQKGWVFVWLGINDLINRDDDAYENLKTLWRLAREDGFKVAAFTTTRGGAFTPETGLYQKWVDLNTRILSDPSKYDAICRPDLLFPVPVNPTYFLDGIHPTPLGAEMLAGWIANSMDGAW